MNNFIHKDYRFCVKVEYNNSIKNLAEKMIESLERHTVEHENQFVSGLPGMTAHAIKLTPEKVITGTLIIVIGIFLRKK